MTEVDRFFGILSKIKTRKANNSVNWKMFYLLEGDSFPRLQEMVRLCHAVLVKVYESEDCDPSHEAAILNVLQKINDMALDGSRILTDDKINPLECDSYNSNN